MVSSYFKKSKSPQKLSIPFVFLMLCRSPRTKLVFGNYWHVSIIYKFILIMFRYHHSSTLCGSLHQEMSWSLEPPEELFHNIMTRILHIEAMHVNIIAWFEMEPYKTECYTAADILLLWNGGWNFGRVADYLLTSQGHMYILGVMQEVIHFSAVNDKPRERWSH